MIRNIDDVRAFFRMLLFEEHLNFHPDDDFADYVKGSGDDTPLYDTQEIEERNELMRQCFDLLGDETYEVGLEEMNRFSEKHKRFA